MNFLKKISPKIVAFLIIVYLSFTLTGCPSTPPTKTAEITEETTEISKLEYDKALIGFWDTYDTFVESSEKERAHWQEYGENTVKINAIYNDIVGLTIKEKEKIGKLSQEALDIIEKMQEILDKIRENIHDRSGIISELQRDITKIKDPSKKLLAQEIADKLREINNLEIESLGLHRREDRYHYSYFEDALFVSQGRMTMEESNKRADKRNEEIKETQEELDEISNTISALIGKVSDLIAKLEVV